jgi:hypothetical protein
MNGFMLPDIQVNRKRGESMSSGITLDQAKTFLATASAALVQLQAGAKSVRYSSNGVERQIGREDLNVLRDDVLYWSGMVQRLEAGGGIVARGVTFL